MHRVDLHVTLVEPEGALVHVAVKMLDACLVPRPVESALEVGPHGPRRVEVDSVRADVFDVLVRAAVYRLVVVDRLRAVVAGQLGRVDGGIRRNVHELDDGGVQNVRRATFDGYAYESAALAHVPDSLLADRAAPHVEFLVGVLIAFLAGHERLIDLDHAAQLVRVAAAMRAYGLAFPTLVFEVDPRRFGIGEHPEDF